jgi:2'-5' RNA ligase
MIRAFFAIDLPAAFIEEIRRLQGELQKAGADVRWVRPEGVHLTLKFLGEAEEKFLEGLTESVRIVCAVHPCPTLTLAGTGVFPDRRKPRVVWVGLEGDLGALAMLQYDIEWVAEAYGFKPEKRAFSPHLTLGRVRSSRGQQELLAALNGLKPSPLSFTAAEVRLIRSDLKPSGVVYTPLQECPLGGGKAGPEHNLIRPPSRAGVKEKP